jgi:hypothetical protein
LSPSRAINISVTLSSGAVVGVNTLSSFCVARINCARFSIITALYRVLALIFGSNPYAFCGVAVRVRFAIKMAFLAVGFGIIDGFARTGLNVAMSKLAIMVKFVVNSIFCTLCINCALSCALRISCAEDVCASSSCCIARINSARDFVVAGDICNFASASI